MNLSFEQYHELQAALADVNLPTGPLRGYDVLTDLRGSVGPDRYRLKHVTHPTEGAGIGWLCAKNGEPWMRVTDAAAQQLSHQILGFAPGN